MSAALEPDLETFAPPARRPGTFTRFLLFLAAVAGSAIVLTVGFPPGARDRLPVLLLSLALALDAVFRPSRAVRDFSYAFPVAGLLAGLLGSANPVAWPVLLFGGLSAGWTFRFLYDFESAPDSSTLDRPLRGLVGLWVLATVVGVVRARTPWALLHGLSGRAVNAEGLPEAAAVRESVMTFAILAAGAGFFFLARRVGTAARAQALRAALVGIAISASAAILQAIGLLPEEARPFWRLTGRHSGGATDPNALGLLCGAGIVVLSGLLLARSDRVRWAIAALLPLPMGLALSGSRSGFLVALLGSAGVIALAPLRGRARLALAAAVLALALLMLLLGSPGGVGNRVGQLFESALTLDDRASNRPVLWRAALRLFSESPTEGGGLGSFSWRLADLVAAERVRLPMRDNPGSVYLQALSESGVVGLALTLLFVGALAGQALARRRDPEALGPAAAVLALCLAFLVGSHWLAPDASFLFFLLAANVAIPGEGPGRRLRRVLVALLVVYAAAAVFTLSRASGPDETFRYSKFIGFHQREAGAGGPFRWTRRRFAVWVRADAPESISLANYSPEGKPVTMMVRAADRVLYRRSLAPGEGATLALWSGGRARAFHFELDRAFVPKRLTGSDDRRELGLLAVLPGDR